ncbi:MAG: hypothetical protein P1U54_07005 [Immundisolibacteraceae bacterium]|nr:hypothetical protein [Immundisolibacteraceae bacterium]
MNHSIEYKYEKLLKAMCALAASRKSIRDRIDDSYHCFWLLKEDEFQGDGKEIRKKIQDLITKNKAKEGYLIPHNIRHMPLARAEEIASLIFKLYDVVATEYLRG